MAAFQGRNAGIVFAPGHGGPNGVKNLFDGGRYLRADSVSLNENNFVLHKRPVRVDNTLGLSSAQRWKGEYGLESAAVRLALSERFRGLFWTQLLGAFNDNFFKYALLTLLVYRGFGELDMSEEKLSEFASAVFIIPFFLLSATAGQIADKYDKAKVIQRLKVVEIIIGVLGAIGFLFESVPLLFVGLALLGVQSAFFGPLKYGIIPQLIAEEDLTEGNAAVETGTKLAILAGTLSGGLLADSDKGAMVCSLAVLIVAVAGFLAAKKIPTVKASDPGLRVEWNPFTPTYRVIQLARRNKAVFLSILGVSWFWALGGGLLTLLPVYGKQVLMVESSVVTVMLGMFSVGVAIGAILCGKFSLHRLELGLVPFGSIGISVFLGHLAFLGAPFEVQPGQLLGLSAMITNPSGVLLLLDLAGISICSGLYIVPLYTMIQQRTEETYRSRVIAANNVINAGVMAFSLILLSKLGDLGLSIVQKFGLLAGLNLLVGLYIYTLIPEFFLRFLAYLLNHVLYRLKVVGESNIPREGAALLVGNHVSFIDWLVVLGGIHRPVRFVMWHKYYEVPIVRYLFQDAGAIPIASGKTHPAVLSAAFDSIDQSLEDGCLVCIFPEGQVTQDGEVGEFRNGLERILERRAVHVVPFALQGLWDSLFSAQRDRSIWSKARRLFRPRVSLVIGERLSPPPPNSIQGLAKELRSQVVGLRHDLR
jgi:1-acyl-sn-glycerol-3-phosphate acyltransferase